MLTDFKRLRRLRLVNCRCRCQVDVVVLLFFFASRATKYGLRRRGNSLETSLKQTRTQGFFI